MVSGIFGLDLIRGFSRFRWWFRRVSSQVLYSKAMLDSISPMLEGGQGHGRTMKRQKMVWDRMKNGGGATLLGWIGWREESE